MDNIILNCKKCGVDFTPTKKQKTPTGYRFRCLDCLQAANKANYVKNISTYKVRAANSKRKKYGKSPEESFSARLEKYQDLFHGYPLYSISDGACDLEGNIFFETESGFNKNKYYVSKRGYHVYRCGLKNKYIHRALAEREFGKSELYVNHKNGIKTDNSLENLEYATPKQNTRHYLEELKTDFKKAYRHNTSSGRVWYSRLTIEGKDKYLGSFHTKEEAESAWDKAWAESYGK